MTPRQVARADKHRSVKLIRFRVLEIVGEPGPMLGQRTIGALNLRRPCGALLSSFFGQSPQTQDALGPRGPFPIVPCEALFHGSDANACERRGNVRVRCQKADLMATRPPDGASSCIGEMRERHDCRTLAAITEVIELSPDPRAHSRKLAASRMGTGR